MCIKDIADTVTMTRFIIFATLMAALFANGISEKTKIILDDGVQAKILTHLEADKCTYKTNIGEEYNSSDDSSDDIIGDRIELGRWGGVCSIVFGPAVLTDAGNWTITSYWDESATNVSQTFTVYIRQEVQVIPNDSMDVVKGNFVYVELDADLENLTSCEAIAPNDTRIDLLTVNRADFRRYGKCGFSAMLQIGDSGRWLLEATTDDNVIHAGYLEIRVHKDGPNEIKNLTLERGYRGQLDLDIDAPVMSCQMTDPLGVIYPETIGPCKHTIPVVTIRDEGIWTASYVIRGKLYLSQQLFNVITYESKTIESNVTRMENGDIQLECHVSNKYSDSLVSCQFITPHKIVLNLFPGIGSDKYRAFNVPSRRTSSLTSHHSCGVIIQSPDLNLDVGIWKCNMNFYKNLTAVSTMFVDSSLLKGNPKHIFITDARSVRVKLSESFQIACSANAPLNYCWIKSPNGTIYSVSQKQPQTLSSLPYRGSGLESGECGAEIDHAEFTDQGRWNCYLGIVNGPEERESFFVEVADSYIIPAESTVYISGEGFIVILHCMIAPSLTNSSVRYYRWVRPDGFGIHNDISRYFTSHTNRVCELLINGIKKDEDVGTWKCVAGLQGAINEEVSANITIVLQRPPPL